MAQLKDSVVSGNLRVTDSTLTDTLQTKIIKAPTSSGGTTYGPGTSGQVLKSNGTTVYWGSDNNSVTGVKGNAESTYRTGNVNLTPENIGALALSGGTMTGVLTAKGNMFEDAYNGAINMNNSDIYGLNSIYTADLCEGAGEGIHFYRDSTHVDTLWMSGGSLLFVPNRELGTNTTAANSQKVTRFTENPTSGQIVVTDGTTGGVKTTGYTTSSFLSSSTKYAGSSSAGGPATNVAIARVSKDSKVFPGANKVVFEEYTNGTNYNLPSNHYYHIMSAQGDDTRYGTQLALGMTTTAAYYRSYNNQTWSDWKMLLDNDNYGSYMTYTSNRSSYASSDTHILQLGYFVTDGNYDNCTILVSSAFWGNQHGSADIINYQQSNNTNDTPAIHVSMSRIRIDGSAGRRFYYKTDNTNNRVYLYVYVTGGNSYGRWNTTVLQSSNLTTYWRQNMSENQPNSGLTEIGYTGRVDYATTSTLSNSSYVVARNTTAGLTTTGIQYAVGQLTIGSADGNAKEGSNASYKLWSYPAGGTAVSSTVANIQNLRLYWSSTYYRDIFMSPNNYDIYHRAVDNNSAQAWRKILDSVNYNEYTVKKDGTGASGTWGISITGSSASCSGTAAYANHLRYGLLVDNRENWSSYPWHKFAEATFTGTNSDPTITFLVSKTWSGTPSGILTAHVRTDGTKIYSDGNLTWHLKGTDIKLENFVMVYTNTANTSTKIELWYKQQARWDGWVFVVLKENHRETVNPKTWTLYSGTDGNSQSAASYTSGTGTVVSALATTASELSSNGKMDYGWNGVNYFNINGTAGNAAKVNDTPTSAWWHIMRFNHGNSAGYYTDLAIPFNDISLYYKRISNGAVQNGGWVKVLDAFRIGYNYSASIKYDPHEKRFTCTKSDNAWNAQAFSTQGFSDNVYVSFRAGQTTSYIMIGLDSNPSEDADYKNIDYCWYIRNDGSLQVYESGTCVTITGHTTYATGDEFKVEYSAGSIKYYHNGVLCRRVIRSISGKLFFDSSFHTAGNIYNFEFGTSCDITNYDKPLTSYYKSTTYVTSLTSSAITIQDQSGSFGGWICGPTKNGRIAIASYQGYDDKLYFGYGERGRTTNSYVKTMTWDGPTNTLTADKFVGALQGNVTGNCSGSSGSCTGNSATATTATKAIQDGNGNNITSTYIPIKTGGGIAECSGNGEYLYYTIATITISGGSINHPILFEISGRGHHFTRLEVEFASSSGTDPGLDTNGFVADGYFGFWIKKTATSTWVIYGKYSETWGNAVLHRITGCGTREVTVTVNMTNYGNSLPDGCTQATYGWLALVADRALRADKASKLSTSSAIGSSTQPVYFDSDGYPATCYPMSRTSTIYDNSSGTSTIISDLTIPADTKYFKIFIFDFNTDGSHYVTNVIDIGADDGYYGGVISGSSQSQSFPCVITAVQLIVATTSNNKKQISIGRSNSWTIGASPSSSTHTLYIRKIIACT